MSRRVYDWRKDCPDDVARRCYPAVVGTGRGEPLERVIKRRKMQGRPLTREAVAA